MFTQLYALGMSTMVENLLGIQTPTKKYIKHIPEDYMGWRVNTQSDNPYMVPCLLIAEIKQTIKFWSIISISITPIESQPKSTRLWWYDRPSERLGPTQVHMVTLFEGWAL